MKNPKDVDAYISTAPKESQTKLNQLRSIIKKSAPQALEKISYGMPYYTYKGRLAYFSAWKTHIGLYIPTPTKRSTKVSSPLSKPPKRLFAFLSTGSSQ